MSNLEVIKKFLVLQDAKTNLRSIVNGYYTYKGRTLYTQKTNDNFELINYSTRIAYIQGNTLYLNRKKYSTTTSKIQTQLFNIANNSDYIIKEYIEGGE